MIQDNLHDDDIREIMADLAYNPAEVARKGYERGETIDLVAGRLWGTCRDSFRTYWAARSFARREWFYARARRIHG